MKDHTKAPVMLTVLFTVILLIFAVFMFIYSPVSSARQFVLSDVRLSMETSRGRERKQQYEYDQVAAEIPLTEEKLAQTAPLAEAAKAEKEKLKKERKALRAEKKRLEQLIAELTPDNSSDDSSAGGAQ